MPEVLTQPARDDIHVTTCNDARILCTLAAVTTAVATAVMIIILIIADTNVYTYHGV
jgi:hypothetical protein